MKAILAVSVFAASAAATLQQGGKKLATQKQQKLIGLGTSAPQESLSVPMRFHQKLLVCNACSGWEGVKILKNDVPTKNKDSLPFNECRYVDGKIFSEDRINFLFEKESVRGSFEIDELPQSDSVLLLIVQRRPETDADLVSFQSFAFAPSDSIGDSARTDAQVAFLNTISGDAETRLRMSDAPDGDRKQATREEQVMFNHVYAIEEGNYSMSLLAEGMSEKAKKALASKIRLNRGEDYVVLKTGTAENPQLVVFPNTQDESIRLINVLYVIAVLGPIIAMGVLLTALRDSSKTAQSEDGVVREEEDVVIAGPAQDEV